MELFGLFGLVILVAAFLLQSAGFFRKKELSFYILNALGAGLLAQYAIAIQNVYFAILESIWFIGAFISLGSICKKRISMNHSVTLKKK